MVKNLLVTKSVQNCRCDVPVSYTHLDVYKRQDENIVKKAQIRRTIETHLDKELRYLDKGIKVLSLSLIHI